MGVPTLHLSGSGWGQVADCCEYGNEQPGSVTSCAATKFSRGSVLIALVNGPYSNRRLHFFKFSFLSQSAVLNKSQ